HDEARALPVRVQLLAIDSPARTDANARHACSNWPGADSIARRALAMLDPRDSRPAQAVVNYAAQPAGLDLWSDDIDRPPPDVPPARKRAQETERPRDLLPARCLQDARNLLDRFGAHDADPDRKPQPDTKPNQDTFPR